MPYGEESAYAAQAALKKKSSFQMKGWSPFTQQEEVKVETEVKEPVKKDSFLENLKKENPDGAYSVPSPHNPNDTLYYIKQGGKWVQTW